MPTFYKRKANSTRGQWSEETLQEAALRLQNNEVSFREAERYYGIPARTLARRIKSGNLTKRGLGPQGNFFNYL